MSNKEFDVIVPPYQQVRKHLVDPEAPTTLVKTLEPLGPLGPAATLGLRCKQNTSDLLAVLHLYYYAIPE